MIIYLIKYSKIKFIYKKQIILYKILIFSNIYKYIFIFKIKN